jgi:CobQ-like glutamine amidotransferase family enzyme
MNISINICHLYPEDMNLYGDLGNVLCLSKRLSWRGVEVGVINCAIGESLPKDIDIIFFGGGQDQDQMRVFTDLVKLKKQDLIEQIESGIPLLAICGGYQLLGEYFLDPKGQRIEGVGALPLETVSPGEGMVNRAVGNLITDISAHIEITSHYTGLKTLVGFENHSGRTRFKAGAGLNALGEVLYGSGDNEDKISDGVIYKNVICSYMHGSLLPKNPHLADYIIGKAVSRKYGQQESVEIMSKQLEDKEEVSAHKYILGRFGK